MKIKLMILYIFLLHIILLGLYFVFSIAVNLSETKMLFRRIDGMKIIVSKLEVYEKDNNRFPDNESILKLLETLNVERSDLENLIPDISNMKYNSVVENDCDNILVWESDVKTSIYPESFLEKYHYEISYCKKNKIMCSKKWHKLRKE